MTTTTASSVLEFGFGFGSLIDLTDGQWTAVSSTLIRSMKPGRGRSSELDLFSAGTMTVELEDPNTRLFDPLNTAGTYYGKLLPGVQVRLRGKIGATYYPIFRGHVTAWRQTQAKQLGLISVPCVDAFRFLANARLPQSVYETVVQADSPLLYWRLSETDGSAAADISGNKWDGTYAPSGLTRGANTLVPYSNVGSLKIDTVTSATPVRGASTSYGWTSAVGVTMALEMWVQSDDVGVDAVFLAMQGSATAANRFAVAYIPSTATTGLLHLYSAGASSSFVKFEVPRLDDGKPHYVLVGVFSDTSPAAYVDGVKYPISATAATAPPDVDAGFYVGGAAGYLSWPGQIGHVALWNAKSPSQVLPHYAIAIAPWANDYTGTRINRVLDLVGWNSITMANIDAGTVILGPADLGGGSALAYLQLIALTEQGRFFIDKSGFVAFHGANRFQTAAVETTSQCNFSDDGAGDSVYADPAFSLDDTFLYNEASVQRKYGSPQFADSTSSIAQYGPRTRTLSGLLSLDDGAARSLAEKIVYRYKDPRSRVSEFTVQPQVDSLLWATILNLEIGHRITLEWKPANVGTQISIDLHVEKIGHDISGDKWTVTFAGSPVDPHIATYFTWGGNGATQGWGVGVWA